MSERNTAFKGNFTAGELSPQLREAEHLGFYNNGAAAIENMIVLPEGGLTRRPGTRFIAPLFNEAQTGLLLWFKFSRTDSRVVCLNGGKGMVFKSGGFIETAVGSGVPYTFDQPWFQGDLPNIRWAEAADVMFVAWGGAPKTIKRYADTDWRVEDYAAVNGPTLLQNVETAKTIGVSDVTGAITLTANFDIFTAAHVGRIFRLDESDLSLITYWTANESVTTGGPPEQSYRRYQGRTYKAKPPPGSGNGAYDSGVNPPTQDFGESQSQTGKIVWEFLYEVQGYVRITAVANARSATATVLAVAGSAQAQLADSIKAKPTYRWSEPAWTSAKGFPTVVCYVQQRLCWLDKLGKFWFTQPGDFYSFRVTADDSSSISALIVPIDGSIAQPRWAFSNGGVIVGAADSEPVIRAPGQFDAITQSNVTVVTDRGQGSAPHMPAVVDAGVAFVGASRQRLNYIRTDRLSDSVVVTELSVASNHVLAGRATGLAYQHEPHRLLWGCSEDGELWCYTLRPDQQVVAAHRHPLTNGFVESIAPLYSDNGEVSELWLIVRRVINGQTRRYVEAMQPFFAPADRSAPTAEGAWFYDCAKEYVGPPVTTISGLSHLRGQQVGIFLEGQDLPRQTVSPAGTVTIPLLKKQEIRCVVGLPIPFHVKTLDLSPQAQGRTTKGAVKRITHAAVDLLNSWSVDIAADAGEGPGESETLPHPQPPLLGAPMPLASGRRFAPIEASHGRAVSLIAAGAHGYPVTLLGLAPDLELSEL